MEGYCEHGEEHLRFLKSGNLTSLTTIGFSTKVYYMELGNVTRLVTYWALVGMVTNCPDTKKVGNFLTSWATASFSRKTLLHEVRPLIAPTKDTLYIQLQGQQCTYNLTLRRVRVTIFAVDKAVSIPYSECVFAALGIQHAKLMRLIILFFFLISINLMH